LRNLVGDPNLYLVEAPALQPAEIIMDPSYVKELEQERQIAEQAPLPDNDDDDDEFK